MLLLAATRGRLSAPEIPLAQDFGRTLTAAPVSPIWRVERRGNQYGEMGRRSYQNVVIGLRREFCYGVTTADEGLRPISPSKLKYPPHPSGRRYQTNQETLFFLVMFI